MKICVFDGLQRKMWYVTFAVRQRLSCLLVCAGKRPAVETMTLPAPPSVMMKALGSFLFPPLRENTCPLLDHLFGSKLPFCCGFCCLVY